MPSLQIALSKTCFICKVNKPADKFDNAKANKDGLHSYCKECKSVQQAKEYKINKSKILARNSDWRKNNIEKVKKNNLEWQRKNKNKLNLNQRKYIKETKEECIKSLGGKCVRCGYSKSYKALHFHHLDPLNKTDKLSNMIKKRNSWEDIKEELNKCELLCANCHAEEHDTFLEE